jgi:O-antigen/teichoic acid export membrane protein
MARIFANTAWLLGGKGFGALCSIGYLVILTRTLGLKDFGHFSLIFATAQALIAIAGFQTWQVVVRYGAPHVHQEDWAKFGRLGMLCGLIDAAGAVMGCIVAFVVIYGFADMLDLNPAYINTAFVFCCAMLWALVSAPTGIVRALDRFDMAVYVEAVVPIGRLLAALAIWWTGPTVGRFLLAWALIDILEAICYWAMARKLCPKAVKLSHLKDWRLALRENEGVGHFSLATYAGSILGAVVRYGPLLAVGGLVGTKAAGLYRLASQLTQSMSKLSSLLTRAVYAEVARASAASAAAELRKLTVQTSMIAGITGAVVVAVALLAGKPLLALIGGEDFERGAVVLVPLAIASSFELASVAFEPVLHSTGRVRLGLVARVLAIIALCVGIAFLHGYGALGVAWAVALAGSVGYVAMGAMAFSTLRRIEGASRDEESTAQ